MSSDASVTGSKIHATPHPSTRSSEFESPSSSIAADDTSKFLEYCTSPQDRPSHYIQGPWTYRKHFLSTSCVLEPAMSVFQGFIGNPSRVIQGSRLKSQKFPYSSTGTYAAYYDVGILCASKTQTSVTISGPCGPLPISLLQDAYGTPFQVRQIRPASYPFLDFCTK
ncbi:hypothetical protein BT96DRAFT_940289 [Gymnopus androsaceus JB14]|uniref:Uncharacterized protein n=1 Tax=Gymnopus androsaceus JB14 TaxID=1447944 RepID=A0A6A4HL22_9AGAR|nr:hypothetical protein BT96DRAFT_940289 [Gymnopus androsaceus JB14]